MEPYNNERKPLVDITRNGSYILKLIRPKDDKIATRFKRNAQGFAYCRLFFLDGDGNCLTKKFNVGGINKESNQVEQWGKGLAMLVGKLTGQFCPAPPADITEENLFRYVEPAFGKKATFHIEVTPDTPWGDKPQYRYKFTKIEPIAEVGYRASDQAEPPAPEDVPY
jgi:hypothetical protein